MQPEQTWRNNPDIKPERKLDGIIEEEVIGYQGEEVTLNGVTVKRWRPWPHYSTDIAAAWLVVEAMEARGSALELVDRIHLSGTGERWWCCFKGKMWGQPEKADTAPLAICRAALAALEVADA